MIEVDVRDDLQRGLDPFSKIMAAVSNLVGEQQLRVVAPFKPIPLLNVMDQRGYDSQARVLTAGDWEVIFTPRTEKVMPPARVSAASSGPSTLSSNAQIIEVDARGLEPPEPMVKILTALHALPVGTQMHALTDRRPVHLYPQLAERGFTGETVECPDGSFLTYVRHV